MIKTIELFAGVGGFRVGLERANEKKNNPFKVIWSNQWEPSTKVQHASDVYEKHWGKKNHSSDDIAEVIKKDLKTTKEDRQIPVHDLLVGGFPCQDYSVAKTLSRSGGIKGKKGVLWWSIYDILDMMGDEAPKYLMLENVDRLLKSPSTQRGRDFAIMLSSLSALGYAAEWRVINAAEYGMPQRRKRVYIMAYRTGSSMNKTIKHLAKKGKAFDWVSDSGIMNEAFPMVFESSVANSFTLEGELDVISENNIDYNAKRRPFANAGVMIDREVYTANGTAKYTGKFDTLGKNLLEEKDVPPEFFISSEELKTWTYLKGSKKEKRTTKTGFEYNYSEGPVTFPDAQNRASRTIITGEGGRGASRFKHVIETKSGKYRRLTPIELERLNRFKDNHTAGQSDAKRAFFMGNALVVDIVKKLGKSLAKRDAS
jgi:DNA (cytosine-5)-methyltransferase 1